jgi:Peptidase family S51
MRLELPKTLHRLRLQRRFLSRSMVVLFKIEGNFPCLRARSAHMVGNLPGGSPGQTDCRVQRPLHPHCELRPTRRCRQRMAVHQRTRTRTPHVRIGMEVLGVLELTALPSIDEELWVPVVRETDVLLVNGGDPLYLCYWMRQSGLADLLPELGGETVYVGLSAGSMVMTPNIGEYFVGWKPPTGGDRTLGIVDFSIFPHLDNPICPTIPWPTLKNGPPACQCRPTRLTIKPLYKWLMASSKLSPKAIGNGLCPSADG